MRRILIVDDSRSVRRSLEACLQPWGFEVEHAQNGADALARLKSSPADLVFLDINMPVLDGPSLLRVMRAQGIASRVVLVTSGAPRTVIASTVKLGAEEYVSKPFTPEQIRGVVGRVLGIDLGATPPHRPRVLAYCRDAAFARRLRALLPEHVEVDPVSLLADALERAGRQAYALVLLDAELAAEAGSLLRDLQPTAGLFAIWPPGSGAGATFSPDGALDGSVPAEPDEATFQDFLYPLYLRPMVFAEGGVLRASGFDGDRALLPAYLAQLTRSLCARSEQEATAAPDVSIDLRRLLDAESVAQVVTAVLAHLSAMGAAPTFTVGPPVHAALSRREDLARAVLLPATA